MRRRGRVGCPGRGFTLEAKLNVVYRLFGKTNDFRSVISEKTGHEYLPEMKEEMTASFDRHLKKRAGGSTPTPKGADRETPL